jgi:hypothetical protein
MKFVVDYTANPTAVTFSQIKDWQTFTVQNDTSNKVYIKLPCSSVVLNKDGSTVLDTFGNIYWASFQSSCIPGPMVKSIKFEE